MTLNLTFPRPGAAVGVFTSPTFTASGRAWRIVVVLAEDGTAGWKPQVRRTAQKPAECDPWEDWRASIGFSLPRAVRKYGDTFQARCIACRRRALGID